MRHGTRMLIVLLGILLPLSAFAQAKRQDDRSENRAQLQQYGPQFDEIVRKYADDPAALDAAARAWQLQSVAPDLRFLNERQMGLMGDQYVVRAETEPNDWFDTADDIGDVLAAPSVYRPGEANGGLLQAAMEAGGIDVFKFTVDTTKIYDIVSTHSFLDTGVDGLDVNMRLFHESDLDTTTVLDFNGTGVDKMSGDILGSETDGRNGSGDFRLTGWTAPIDPTTGAQVPGDYYLFIFNEDGDAGTYYIAAYMVNQDDWVGKFEPNQNSVEALTAGSILPTDAVTRTFVAFNPDTVKDQELELDGSHANIQANSTYPVLFAQGDEDIDNFLFNYEAGKTIVIETLPYHGWYRDRDGTIGPGGSRMNDPRIRLYDADFTGILAEDDDGGREQMDGPNNIHSRIVMTPEALAAQGITEDTPLWLWVGAWASRTRDPGFGTVNNDDPGRFMYDVYIHQYDNNPGEVEPNDDAAGAQSIAARSDTVTVGSMADGTEDWYRVFLHEVRMYTMFVSDPAVTMEVFHEFESDNVTGATDLTGNLLAAAAKRTVDEGVVAGFVPERSGAYLIKLTGGAGDYQFGVLDKGEVWDGLIANEPDDVAEDALENDPIEIGAGAAAKNGMIYPAGDLDHYFFTAAAGTELTLSIAPSNAALVNDFDVQMTLIDPEGAEVGTVTDKVAHTTLLDGTYIIQVKAVNEGDVGFYVVSGGEPFEEKEPNNNFGSATEIALGGNIYEAALTGGDVDFFKMTMEVGKLYSLRGLDNETGGALEVEFFDVVNGTTLMDDSGWPDNYGENFKIANIMPRATKTYYLKISGAAGPYKITSRVNEDFLALKEKGEPNNTPAEADAMGNYQAFGADVPFVLFNQEHPRFYGDEDWFRVELVAGQKLTAEAKPVGGDDWNRDTDTKVCVFDETGATELDCDDDGGNDWYSKLEYVAAADGVHYVQVRTSRSTESADDRSMNRGDYILNIDVTSEEVEPNNTFAEADANMLKAGFVDATFADDDLSDIFRLDLKADHIYHIRTIRPEDGYSGDFELILSSAADPGVNLLADHGRYTSRYSGDNVKINFIPEADAAYYLQLDGAAAGAYKVGLKGRDISELKAKGEPNNSVEDADAIGAQAFDMPGQANLFMLYNADFAYDAATMEITTQYSDDRDFFKYELSAGDTLIAETSPADGPLWARDYDGYMELHAADGSELATNDDGGFDWHSKITYVAEADMPVYVVVRSQDFFDCWNGGECDRDPARGEYKLTVLKKDGSPIAIPTDREVPGEYRLDANYPNPFNPTTTITFAVPNANHVRLTVYNALGQQVMRLVDQDVAAGVHQATFDAMNLSSGVYIYRLEAGDFVQTRKMLLIK